MIQTSKFNNGFTLIETMVVILIFSLLAFAAPNLGQIMDNNRLKGTVRDLYSNMQKAKLEAISRNENVVVNFISAPYTPQGGAGTYTIFVDNGEGPLVGGIAENFIQDGNEPTLINGTMPINITLISASFTGGTSIAGYNSRGLPANSRIGNVQIRNAIRWYRLSLSIAGNLRMENSSDGTWPP